MPERPKRRKNNKNKRKNKNFRADPSVSNSRSNDDGDTQSLENKDVQKCETDSIVEEKIVIDNLSESVSISTSNNFENVQIVEESCKTDTNVQDQEISDNLSEKTSTCDTIGQVEKNVEEKCENNSIVQIKDIADNLSQKTSTTDDVDKVFKNCTNGDNNIKVSIEPAKLFLKGDNNSAILCDTVEGTLNNAIISNTYVVESPDQSNKKKSKLSSSKKSKSVDDDESPKITEITDETPSALDPENTISSTENSGLVVDIDSDVEWENTVDLEEHKLPKIEELVTGTLTVTTMPLTVAHCEQAKLLSPEEEQSLRRYLQTLNLATSPSTSLEIKTEIEQIINSEIKHRLRKKGFADDVLSQRLCPPRTLDVIDEEGSGDSSIQSRRHSYLSDKKSDIDDLEDDVFEKPGHQSALKKKYDTHWNNKLKEKSSTRQIPQTCVLVGAKLKEPEICEARGGWSVQTVEKMTGAEIVYLTDSSSSTSSIYDVGEDETENGQDTDVSVRMITPTIEVTDTENFLKKTFISDNKNNISITEQKSIEAKNDLSSKSEESFKTNYKHKSSVDEIDRNLHEVVVLSTDNIKTNLTVKDVDEMEKPQDTIKTAESLAGKSESNYPIKSENRSNSSKRFHDYDLEMKVLKCELNDAINHLIMEVSDSEIVNESSKDSFTRQDSSSSLSSSQCTAIYNPNSSLNDLSNNDDSSQISKEIKDYTKESTTTSHVNDVIEHIHTNSAHNIKDLDSVVNQPQRLRDICVDKISSFPYGLKILEELANVSLRLQSMNNLATDEIINNDLIEITKKKNYGPMDTSNKQTSNYTRQTVQKLKKSEDDSPPPIPPPPIPPPPVIPRKTSLKKSQEGQSPSDVQKVEVPYICLSPSQKMLMEKTNTVVTNMEKNSQENISKINVNRPIGLKSQQQFEKPTMRPLKSETGSRLMALISDPSITSNIKSSLNKFNDEQSHFTQKIEETKSSRKYSDPDQRKFTSDIFKPIPPPRPKKMSSSYYESDENSDFAESSFKTMKSEKRSFHFSTGNLNKEIEDDISTIQNMHRNYVNVRDQNMEVSSPRRPSLPQDLCDQQMEYIRQKEKEVEAEIRRLEEEKIKPIVRKGPRAPMLTEKDINNDTLWNARQKHTTRGTIWTTGTMDKSRKDKNSNIFSSSQEELLREKMYSEYLNEISEREQRKHHKVIKITKTQLPSDTRMISKSMSALDVLDARVNNRIEEEFISKARERWSKLGIRDPESEDERNNKTNVYREPKVIEHKIKVIEAGEEKDVHNLPNHLQEFVTFTADKNQEPGSTETVMIAPTFRARSTSPAVWRPGAPAPSVSPGAPVSAAAAVSPGAAAASSAPPPPPPPVWSPAASPQAPRKPFRPVHFEDTPPARRKFVNTEQNGCTSGSESEGRLRTSLSAPAAGLSALGATSRLPRVQNPTVTLLQKARENHLSRASNIQERDPRLPRDRPSPPIGDPVHALRKGYLSEGEADRREYVHTGSRKMADANRKVEGIGPTTKEGMPVALRSEVKDPSRWYKKMYDTIHKNKYDDDYVTIRYKNRQGQPPLRVSSSRSQYAYFDPRSGYLSEPEGGLGRLSACDAYDSDVTTGHRRRTASVQEDRRDDFVYLPNNKYSTLASARASQEVYKNQPGRIENYVPGKSSVVDKEAKQWWDEVMDIFDGQNISSTTSLPQTSPKEKKDVTSTILSKSNMARALKESGYESDSTLIFRRREETDTPLSPAERRAAYKDLQAGGEPPLRGFRSPAPPRQDDSEIEYIPISSTLTKIRVHKKTPHVHEIVCYPLTNIQSSEINDTSNKIFKLDRPDLTRDFPPAPPRRISSKNSKTLKFVTSSRHSSISPIRTTVEDSNVNFLKNKLNNKLNRQNTHVILKKDTKMSSNKLSKCRELSTSAPPSVNRKDLSSSTSISKRNTVERGTSSFSSPRRTLQPTEYSTQNKPGDSNTSVVIENGAGRRTPISNILDKVTSLDKLWSSQKRNERIDVTKYKERSMNKISIATTSRPSTSKTSSCLDAKTLPRNVTHKSRDMVRTSEKIQKLKSSNTLPKPNFPLTYKSATTKSSRLGSLQATSNISKSTSNIPSNTKKVNNIRTAVVTNLKKKKSLESVVIRPRSVPCHETCNKKTKYPVLKKESVKSKTSDTSLVAELAENQFKTYGQEGFDYSSPKDITRKQINPKDLKETRESVLSDSFFRHLFLGSTPVPANSIAEQSLLNSVQEKAKHFQSLPQTITPNTSNKFNSYLIHRKPVSLSRFKAWDKNSSPTRTYNARSVSWPGKMDGEIRKFQSLSKPDGFGSMSSLSTIRSKSEPPTNKIYFSQTSRPVSPSIVFYKKTEIERKSVSPSKIIYLQPRSTSPYSIHKTPHVKFSSEETSKKLQKPIKTIQSENDDTPNTISFSQKSRPVSPKVKNTSSKSRSQSTSPVSFRSPSYRRIHNARVQSRQLSELCRKENRTKSADSLEINKYRKNDTIRAKSDTNLYTNDPDYDEYIQDIQNSKLRSERFRELNRYYAYLERVAELEKATSTCDLRHRKKDEEIIDFDRWKKIRAIERAEEELNNLYHKLKVAQSENSILFYPKDLNDFRWNSGKERGLRVKEKSVEDLKEEFQQKTYPEPSESGQFQDRYKPLWRGKSVAETAFNINKKGDSEQKKSRITNKSIKLVSQDTSFSELQKKLGLKNHLWSSLSMDQVNALKNQLNAIYSKELETKTNKEHDKYTVEIKDTNNINKPALHVRCNSLITSPTTAGHGHDLSKSDSIAAIAYTRSSEKDMKNNVNKQMSLSEIEKKKISQSLSKEVLNRINKNEKSEIKPLEIKQISTKESDNTLIKNKNEVKSRSDLETNLSSLITRDIEDKRKRHIVFPIANTETTYHSSTSETETGSSDISNKTAIYKGPSKEVLKKVEYFESVTSITKPNVIYSSRENSEEATSLLKVNSYCRDIKADQKPLSQSQSCTNIKELFGESEKNKFLSLPSQPDLHSRSPSPYSEVCISDRHTPDTLRYSSDEAMWRSRTPSPDPERYWRAYIKLARAGEVRRLARRFDSPSAAGAVLRRHRSDPEIARNVLNINWSSTEKNSPQRERCRAILPVARIPLRPTNRFMPHIDVISKLAALRKRTSPRSRSAEEALECRPGEVERIRKRFEAMSLLGPIYSSAPDVRELHDIAPYLAGSWIAHRYPKPSDNNRSIPNTETLINGRKSPIKKEPKLAMTKDSVKLSSILKCDHLAKQEFDPAAHRPASRYEPPRAPPRPPPAAWPQRLAPFVTASRHTVTFQENDSAPEPPRRVTHGSYSDTESPSRRYVEGDVNIHYRCPVRREPLPLVPERELARHQAEHMKRLYRDQKRHKYLQEKDIHLFDIEAFDASIKELQDMQNRRHQDNFMPSQKTVVPLNRYDEAEKLVARALYAFNGQTTRELTFKKGDLINVRRQIDSNWYEGEVHGRIGLFPYNYVEILKGDTYTHSPKKPVAVEGQARAKFDFTAQTNLELPLKKGEVVVLTRRIDQNWWEGRNGTKTGIFPDSYVTVLQEPSQAEPPSLAHNACNVEKPAASPAAHGLVNGAARRTLQQHSYTPQHNSPALANAPPATAPLPVSGYLAKPAHATLASSERGYGAAPAGDLNNAEPLYVDTNAEAVPYRAMYKYRPQNPDELELQEGDTVYVLEKCDDGWYVGSSQRTGRFGTFPGNYVERI
ncbi:PREDICTED: uncharacterized protein LOC106115732 isoform X4 [Papilio xuthus]|uniref:Uncharacterized protein LOC106115732 isoform X4 n=1 Tax=Papilio xuthus TaxID=66420 RepID=A0AAJ7E675_PAPXU|nr:PREDICTED: uncharacterized protein LOC106115732 isoform X4 [Papilio xuthus]